MFDLADPRWKGRSRWPTRVSARPRSTWPRSTAELGDAKADDLFRRLRANNIRVVDGNSTVRDLVVRGEVKAGLTDTDDVNVAIENGDPVAMVLPDREAWAFR